MISSDSNKKRRRLRRIALAVGVVAAVFAGEAGPAFADGFVTWTNARTGACLRSDKANNGTFNVYTNSCTNPVTSQYPDIWWYDVRQTNGSFTEHPRQVMEDPNGNVWYSYYASCLKGNREWSSYGSVSMQPCSEGSSNADLNQDWIEIHLSNGSWLLHNWMSGWVLDGGNGPNANGQFASQNLFVNTLYNNDMWQQWH
ncbi:hypothetical protein GCM10009839_06890 [Catenulispora yoronensis]|uniref:Ricin B lectin domain-containing protein n=1 Tax=Catenulispora yoronensis TaxID=450799 RepID=A0ABP5F4M1_9ACTN